MDIRADIVNIATDIARKDDRLLVDTNVLFWWFYPDQLTESRDIQQKRSYDTYFEKIAQVGAQLYYCQASLIELAHVIEKTKLEIYNRVNNTLYRLKEYRHQAGDERKSVVEAIESCWESIKNNAEPIDVTYDDRSLQHALAGLTTYQVDAYDYIQIDAMQMHNITDILTDDGDYATVAAIRVFTNRWQTINQARGVNKLIRR